MTISTSRKNTRPFKEDAMRTRSKATKSTGMPGIEDSRRELISNPQARSLAECRRSRGMFSIDDLTSELTDQSDIAMVTDTASLPPSNPWTEDFLIQSCSNFNRVPRVSVIGLSLDKLMGMIYEHEQSGVPLILSDYHKLPEWDSDVFSLRGLIGDEEQDVQVRDMQTSTDVKIPLHKLVEHYESFTDLETLGDNHLYGKDIPCPKPWEEWLRSHLPSHFHPFGDNDMFSHLAPKNRPETLMCYLGLGETFTAAHKDLCGSFGHNLMCHTTDGGSAFWFMSNSGSVSMDIPAMYFRDKLGSDLDLEQHQATLEEFQNAPFPVYVAEQKLGDLVLVPPRSCHQVINRGGITAKMSWSRMGLKSLEYSLHSELTMYHRVCRPETYRVKLTLFTTVTAYAERLPTSQGDLSREREELPKLLKLFDEMLIEEWADQTLLESAHPQATEDLHSCDFCGADIFQSFFACSKCTSEDITDFICCPSCYVEGRSCQCGLACMEPRQSWPFDELISVRNKAADALNLEHVNEEYLKNHSGHLAVFRAACLLRKKAKATSEKDCIRRCRSHSKTTSHDTEKEFVVQCGQCHGGKCYTHILELYGLHVVPTLLFEAQGTGVEWHSLHGPSGSGERKRNLEKWFSDPNRTQIPSLEERMAWAAKTFRTSRPIDDKRAKPGFYDYTNLVVEDSPSPDRDAVEEMLRDDDDDDEMNEDADIDFTVSSDCDDWPLSRVRQSILARPATSTKPSIKPVGIRPKSLQKIPYVLIPKRKVTIGLDTLTRPTKRPRLTEPPVTSSTPFWLSGLPTPSSSAEPPIAGLSAQHVCHTLVPLRDMALSNAQSSPENVQAEEPAPSSVLPGSSVSTPTPASSPANVQSTIPPPVLPSSPPVAAGSREVATKDSQLATPAVTPVSLSRTPLSNVVASALRSTNDSSKVRPSIRILQRRKGTFGSTAIPTPSSSPISPPRVTAQPDSATLERQKKRPRLQRSSSPEIPLRQSEASLPIRKKIPVSFMKRPRSNASQTETPGSPDAIEKELVETKKELTEMKSKLIELEKKLGASEKPPQEAEPKKVEERLDNVEQELYRRNQGLWGGPWYIGPFPGVFPQMQMERALPQGPRMFSQIRTEQGGPRVFPRMQTSQTLPSGHHQGPSRGSYGKPLGRPLNTRGRNFGNYQSGYQSTSRFDDNRRSDQRSLVLHRSNTSYDPHQSRGRMGGRPDSWRDRDSDHTGRSTSRRRSSDVDYHTKKHPYRRDHRVSEQSSRSSDPNRDDEVHDDNDEVEVGSSRRPSTSQRRRPVQSRSSSRISRFEDEYDERGATSHSRISSDSSRGSAPHQGHDDSDHRTLSRLRPQDEGIGNETDETDGRHPKDDIFEDHRDNGDKSLRVSAISYTQPSSPIYEAVDHYKNLTTSDPRHPMITAVPDDGDRLDVEMRSPEQQYEEGSNKGLSVQNCGSTTQPDAGSDHTTSASGVYWADDDGPRTPPRDSTAGYTGSLLQTSQDDLDPLRSDAWSYGDPDVVSSLRSTADN